MAVFRDVALTWNGEEHHMTPSAALLRRISAKGINNLKLAQQCLQGGVDPAELCVAHVAFLQAAGVEVTEDESYAFLTGPHMEEIVAFQTAYVWSVMPSIDSGKKPEAVTEQASAPTRQAKRKKRRK